MWSAEGDKYWEKAQTKRNKRRRFTVILPACTLLFAALSVCLSRCQTPWFTKLPHSRRPISIHIANASTSLCLSTPGILWPLPKSSSTLLHAASDTDLERKLHLTEQDLIECVEASVQSSDARCLTQCAAERDTFPRCGGDRQASFAFGLGGSVLMTLCLGTAGPRATGHARRAAAVVGSRLQRYGEYQDTCLASSTRDAHNSLDCG
jgi:hypothetical protein